MAERRQAHRREPIIVELPSGVEIEVHPLPWQARNDVGDEIINQSQEITNEAIRVYVDQTSGAPQLEMRLNEKLRDPGMIVAMGLPGVEIPSDTTYSEIHEIIYAILDVNDLEKLRPLVDPNFQTPTTIGGESLSGLESLIDGVKTPSSEGSSSEASIEEPLSPSPTERSSVSSEKVNE